MYNVTNHSSSIRTLRFKVSPFQAYTKFANPGEVLSLTDWEYGQVSPLLVAPSWTIAQVSDSTPDTVAEVQAILAASPSTHTHANLVTLAATEEAFTTVLKTAYDQAAVDDHTHSNITVLDATEESLTTVLKAAYDQAVTDDHTHSNLTTLDATEEAFTTALKGTYDAAGDYAPGTPTDWAGTPPTTIAEALDRLAAANTPVP